MLLKWIFYESVYNIFIVYLIHAEKRYANQKGVLRLRQNCNFLTYRSLKKPTSKSTSSIMILDIGKDTSKVQKRLHTKEGSSKSISFSHQSILINPLKWNSIPKFGIQIFHPKLERSVSISWKINGHLP